MRRGAVEEGRRWLEQAAEDLHWARHLAEHGGHHISCFPAQQVSEKALKAYLYACGEEVVIGHSVERLCSSAAQWAPEFGEFIKEWSLLDGYYIPTRYPNSLPDSIPARVYTASASAEAVRLAAQVVAFVGALIEGMEQGEGSESSPVS